MRSRLALGQLVVLVSGWLVAGAYDSFLLGVTDQWEDKGFYPPDVELPPIEVRAGRTMLRFTEFSPTQLPTGQHVSPKLPANGSEDAMWEHELYQSETKDPRRGRRRRCRATRGTWCGQLERQHPIPAKPPPRGNKDCPKNCNNVGVCDYDTGMCSCPAGWTGADCATVQKRPCTNRNRDPSAGQKEPMSHIDAYGRDLDLTADGWTASRCAGVCDDETAACWCDGNKGRAIAPPGSPPGTPVRKKGRPLSEFCSKVKSDGKGKATRWGNVPWEKLYAPDGFCQADVPSANGMCDNCFHDGVDGPFCDEEVEAFCLNQCSGHGDCKLGFCKCYEGWYGTDCSRKRAGSDMEPSDADNGKKPWLRRAGTGMLPPAAAVPPVLQSRRRPLVYVYDVPPAYTTRMLQYRVLGKACVYRRWSSGNETKLNDWLYAVEVYFHEQLLLSPHRTFDPEEADFFFVPWYPTCYFWPIHGWADFPWWYAPAGPRVMHGANMALELKRHLEETLPYWKRKGGRDHIWITAADEGACWLPKEIYENSIILTHWGRLDTNHTSNTAYGADNYNSPFQHPVYQPQDWREMIQGHACYNPDKDLVIPSVKPPSHYSESPLMGKAPYQRDILMYLRGDVGHNREPNYSRGIRQRLYRLHLQGKWREKYSIYLGRSDELHGIYTEHLARSKFCLVAPGDGWSARAEDAVLHGCIPVVIMDQVHSVFESILDWDLFSVRIKESSLDVLPQILLSYTPDQVSRMQRRLSQVWHRFAWMQGRVYQEVAEQTYAANAAAAKTLPPLPAWYPIHPHREFPTQDDAFNTIMQWLYTRIADVHKPVQQAQAASATNATASG